MAKLQEMGEESIYFCGDKQVPTAVVESIARKFNRYNGGSVVYGRIMEQLQYDGLNGCFYFMWANMYHGVEPDGYIHT